MTAQVEIYALMDPSSRDIRYIGKANCSKKRFQSHIRDSRRRSTPVYCWIRKLVAQGKLPVLEVLEVVPQGADWKPIEQAFIAVGRERGWKLLNVADGGDEPYCSPEVRAANGRKVAATRRKPTDEEMKVRKLNMNIAMRLRYGKLTEKSRALIRYAAQKAPDKFGQWAWL